MRSLRYLLVSLASALASTLLTVWLLNPGPAKASITLPPLKVEQAADDLLVWGSWRTVEGYEAAGANAIEVRCNRQRNSCSESFATLLQHDAGEDLEAQVFEYQVTSWTEQRLEAVAPKSMAECINRKLIVNLQDQSAALELQPAEDCDGDTGRAVLLGDLL
jgi:hypothetical protein